jgi:hypothetical protein
MPFVLVACARCDAPRELPEQGNRYPVRSATSVFINADGRCQQRVGGRTCGSDRLRLTPSWA